MLVRTDKQREWWVILVMMLALVLTLAIMLIGARPAGGATQTAPPPDQGTWKRYDFSGTDMQAVEVLHANDVWVAGTDGVLAHWDGSEWTMMDNSGFGTGNIYAIDMLSSKLGWASAERGRMLRWDGTDWTIEPGNITAAMRAVSMVSSTDGWAGGDAGILAHYNGETWQQVAPGGNLTNTIWGLHMTGPNDGWAVTGNSDQSGMVGRLYHYNGSAWQEYPTAFGRVLYAVDMLNPDYGWAVGSGGTMLRWDGTQWTQMPSPVSTTLTGVCILSETDAWASGLTPSTLMHWDGTEWTLYSVPNSVPVRAVCMSSGIDVWAVGERGTIYKFDGDDWHIAKSYASYESFQGLDFVSAKDGWLVGSYNTMVTGLLHWNGIDWTGYPAPPGFDQLHDVDMVSSDAAWAVGRFGKILHWNGTEWTLDTKPSDVSAIAVSMVSATDGWAVGFRPGNTGVILHWDGTQWTLDPFTNPYQWRLDSIDMGSASEGWIGGASGDIGVMVHYQYGVWTPYMEPFVWPINAIDMISADDGWAVGPYNLVVRYQNGTWNPVTVMTEGSFYDISMLNSDEGWMVGSNWHLVERVLLMHYQKGVWTQVTSPSWHNILDIKTVDADHVWAIGDDIPGVILYYEPPVSPTPTATVPPIPTPTDTPMATVTPVVPTPTNTPPVPTFTPTSTPTECAMTFTDVQPTDYFYAPVHYLYCAGAISGYNDNTFRPYNNTTRAQMSKIIVLARGFPLYCPDTGHFSDVPPNSPFFCYVETAYGHGIVSGYADGTFRPGNEVTRGQLSKMVVVAMGWTMECPTSGHFSDVPTDSTFYCYIETAYEHNIISGYADGTFKPGNAATRGQICKIVYGAITAP